MDSDELVGLLRERGALLEGHFLLTSGRHSDAYIEKFRVMEDPRLARRIGEAMAKAFDGYQVVAAPALGAVILGFCAAEAAGVRLVIAEKADEGLRFGRGFRLERGDRVLVVEDVITTGGSTKAVVDLVRERGAEPVGVIALVDRTPEGSPDVGAPFRALARIEVATWEADACPLCRDGVPLTKPKER